MVQNPKPIPERHLRPLTSLPPDEQFEAAQVEKAISTIVETPIGTIKESHQD